MVQHIQRPVLLASMALFAAMMSGLPAAAQEADELRKITDGRVLVDDLDYNFDYLLKRIESLETMVQGLTARLDEALDPSDRFREPLPNHIRMSNGAGAWTPVALSYHRCSSRSETQYWADFNGDGRDDLLCLKAKSGEYSNEDSYTQYSVSLSLSNSDGTITLGSSNIDCGKLRSGRLSFTIGDFDGNGSQDFKCGAGVFLSNRGGTFSRYSPDNP